LKEDVKGNKKEVRPREKQKMMRVFRLTSDAIETTPIPRSGAADKELQKN